MTGNASAATIVVNSLADNVVGSNGQCTLREALANANSNSDTTGGDCAAGSGADTVNLTALSGTITLGGTQLLISDSTTIAGPGPGALTIDANNASRVFYIYNNASTLAVTISGMTLTRGQIGGGTGSVIGNRGENVTLNNLTINNSVPRFGVVGNPVGVAGVLTIQNCTITGNTGGVGNGGGVYNWGGNLTISGSTITGNSATKGGGIFGKNISNPVSITNSTVSNNTATGSRAGGIGLYVINSAVTISSSIISGNTAANRGGALFLYKLNAPMTISETTISGNTSNSFGGGIFLYKSTAPGPLTIQRSTISGNSTASRGGGLFLYRTNSATKLEDSTVSGNTAVNGGGFYMRGAFGGSHSLTIQASTIAFNTASATGGNINGGNSANSITVTNSIIAGGSAPTGPDIRTGSATITLNYSLLQDTSGATIGGANNLTGVSPALLALANNGGPTRTHAFLASSPVVNAGDPSGAGLPATDQRGLTRVVGGVVDMGAVELQAAASAKPIPNLPSLPPVTGIGSQPIVLDLSAGQGPAMTVCLQDAARAFFGADATYLGQAANGSARISQGGRILSFYAVDANSVGSPTPALRLGSSNLLDVSTSCGVFTIIPALYNVGEFGAALNAMGLSAQINQQGVITVVAGDTIFVGRPDYVVVPGGASPAGLVLGADALYRFTDSAGFTQVLRPAFLDTDGLSNQLPAILGIGTVVIETDGSAVYRTYAGQQYVLVPDLTLTRPSQANAASLWWQDGANHFQFRSSTLVYAQGFTPSARQ